MKSRTIFWLTAALMLFALHQHKRWNTQEVFDWDAGGYFAYLPAVGHSWPCQEAAMLAGAAYAILGLWVLRKLLRHYYPDRVVAWAVAVMALVIKNFVCDTHKAANACAVLFLWQAALLCCAARWYETPERCWALGMGLW